MLASILHFGDEDDITVSRPEAGLVELSTLLDGGYVAMDWSESETLLVELTMDEESYEVTDYFMSWRFETTHQDSCPRYDVAATEGAYGIDVVIPDAIATGSDNLP